MHTVTAAVFVSFLVYRLWTGVDVLIAAVQILFMYGDGVSRIDMICCFFVVVFVCLFAETHRHQCKS